MTLEEEIDTNRSLLVCSNFKFVSVDSELWPKRALALPILKRRIYLNREVARLAIFNYIEMYYNPVRRHGSNGLLSPTDYERQYGKMTEKCLRD